ncbi:hypothetical protein ABBQ32_006535 [Trebouxia sp. C0010 RCD-2024]
MGSDASGPRVRTLENTESRPRDMMRTRRHPFLASHNAWTWKFLPGIVVGFLTHLWLSHNRESKGSSSDTESQDDEEQWQGNVKVPEEELKMILVVNKELGMRAGKVAAQCAHAAVGVVEHVRKHNQPLLRQWEQYGAAKVAVKCPKQAEMMQIKAQAREEGIPFYLVTDAGRTQIAAGSQTVLALGPWAKSRLDKLTGHLGLL